METDYVSYSSWSRNKKHSKNNCGCLLKIAISYQDQINFIAIVLLIVLLKIKVQYSVNIPKL